MALSSVSSSTEFDVNGHALAQYRVDLRVFVHHMSSSIVHRLRRSTRGIYAPVSLSSEDAYMVVAHWSVGR